MSYRIPTLNEKLLVALRNGRGKDSIGLLKMGASAHAAVGSALMRTALHLAAHNNLIRATLLLLDMGADVNARGGDMQTPLHCASKRGHVGMMNMLIENGSAVNAEDDDGLTPLHLAAYGGHVAATRKLLADGAHVDALSARDITPLHLASLKGREGVVLALLENGACIDEKDGLGRTALHRAVIGANKSVVILLTQHGADVNTRAADGETPLTEAVKKRGSTSLIRVLLSAGAARNDIPQAGKAYGAALKLRLRYTPELLFRFIKKLRLLDICVALAPLDLPVLIVLEIYNWIPGAKYTGSDHDKWAVMASVKRVYIKRRAANPIQSQQN